MDEDELQTWFCSNVVNLPFLNLLRSRQFLSLSHISQLDLTWWPRNCLYFSANLFLIMALWQFKSIVTKLDLCSITTSGCLTNYAFLQYIRPSTWIRLHVSFTLELANMEVRVIAPVLFSCQPRLFQLLGCIFQTVE